MLPRKGTLQGLDEARCPRCGEDRVSFDPALRRWNCDVCSLARRLTGSADLASVVDEVSESHNPAEPEPKRLGRVIAAFGRPSQILFPNVEDFVPKGLIFSLTGRCVGETVGRPVLRTTNRAP